MNDGSRTTQKRIIDRIRKLLRLARSDNLHEAAVAAGRAQGLLSRYQLEEASLGDLDEDETSHVQAFCDEDGLYSSMRLPFWLLRLAANLADLNNCECFVQIKGKRRVIGLVGSPRDASLIRYMFRYLKREIQRLCSRYAQEKKSTKWRNNFKLGTTDEIILRMQRTREDVFRTASSTALARISSTREAARQWMRDQNPRKGRKSKPRSEDFAYIMGRAAGASIELEAELALPEPTKQLEEHPS